MRSIAFDFPSGELHHYLIKPLDSRASKLIIQRLKEMNPVNNTIVQSTNDKTENDIVELVRMLEVIMWNLNQIKAKISKIK